MSEIHMESDRVFPSAQDGTTQQSKELRKHMADTGVSWKVASTTGDKKSKKWFTDKAGENEVTQDQWEELWEGIQSMPTAEKTAFLTEHYEITYQTLQRKVGKTPEPRAKKSASPYAGSSRAMTARSKEDVESGLEEHIEALREDLEKSEARLKRLREMDDEEYEEMRALLIG